jgi:Rieske Fe-S protein
LFQWLVYAAGVAAGVAAAVPFVGFLLGVVRKPPELWKRLGQVNEFPLHETRLVTFENPIRQPWDGQTAHIGVYVRNQGPDAKGQAQFLVLAMNCAHLGCPVSWFPQSGLFMCPCHGGVYYENGERASGPPPRGLFHCVWEVRPGAKGEPALYVQAPHLPTLQNTLTKPASA